MATGTGPTAIRAIATGSTVDSGGGLAKVTYLPGVAVPATVAPSATVAEVVMSTTPAAVAAEPDSDWAAEEQRAESVSMRALTRRGMSRWELGQALLSQELDEGIVEAELDRLEGVGLIDDAALAETIVRTHHERKGLGRSALIGELRKRKIDQETIDVALEQIGDDDEAGRALEMAERRARQLTGLDHATAVRRLSGYLQRKGYSSELIRSAVATALPKVSSGVRFR